MDKTRKQEIRDEAPHYLLWRLVEAFQGYRQGFDADEPYVKATDHDRIVVDLLAALDAAEQERDRLRKGIEDLSGSLGDQIDRLLAGRLPCVSS